jgi:hypothetical protein
MVRRRRTPGFISKACGMDSPLGRDLSAPKAFCLQGQGLDKSRRDPGVLPAVGHGGAESSHAGVADGAAIKVGHRSGWRKPASRNPSQVYSVT